jgi:hypothetical protein
MKRKLDRPSLKKSIGIMITGRAGIVSLDLFIVLIALGGLLDAFFLWRKAGNDFSEIVDLIDGIAAILVAYGVAMEERETFMEILGLYPERISAKEKAVDHLCHVYGLCVLITALFAEFLAVFFKVSSSLRGIEGSEPGVFGVLFLCNLSAVFLLLRHGVRLMRLQ